MSKLKSAVLYEYLTKVRAIGIFYLIQYLIVALIFAIVAICTEGKETGSNALEFSSVVFVSVIGVLGYKEDFKALLQNGYTRKYIFVCLHCWRVHWRLLIPLSETPFIILMITILLYMVVFTDTGMFLQTGYGLLLYI